MKKYVNTRLKDRKNAFDELYKIREQLDVIKTIKDDEKKEASS